MENLILGLLFLVILIDLLKNAYGFSIFGKVKIVSKIMKTNNLFNGVKTILIPQLILNAIEIILLISYLIIK